MDRYIKFVDYFSATLDQEKNKDFLSLLFPSKPLRKHLNKETPEDSVLSVPRVLGVRIAATHAARVTDNNGFYLPDRVKAGAGSWLEPFSKPILLHHEKSDDAIGRIENAQYIDTSEGFKRETGWIKRADKLVGDYPSDRLLDAFIEGKLTPTESVDVVRNVFVVKDFNYTRDATYEGLGYIELKATISDPDSVRKVLDKRYLTGSIGARSDAAVCSVCKKDWVKDGRCDHHPGKEYSNILCVVIAGNLVYDEYSYVNRPADGLSRNLEIFVDGKVKDSVSFDSSDTSRDMMFDIEDSLTELDSYADNTEGDTALSDLQKELGEDYDSVVGTNPTEDDLLYARMLVEVKNGLLGLTEEDTKAFLDAKLTAEARKNLPKSVFCKPPSGYPVDTCNRAKAAMAYAQKYNESASVVSCIKRKASRLGCPFGETKKDQLTEGEFVVSWFDTFSDEQLMQMSLGLDKAKEERGLECDTCSDIANAVLSLKAENESLKSQLAELSKDNTLQNELVETHKDIENLRAMLVESRQDLKKNRVSHLVAFKMLSGEKVEDTAKCVAEMMAYEEDQLQAAEKEIKDKVDVEKLNQLLTSGLVRVPEEGVVVSDPSLRYTDGVRGTEQAPVVTKETLDQIKAEYVGIRLRSGQSAADRYLDSLKQKGLLPKENPCKG